MMRETGISSGNAAICLALQRGDTRQETLAKAKASGAAVLIEPYIPDGRVEAIVQCTGVYIAEIHAAAQK